MRLQPPSPLQRQCIIAATIAPLVYFRRGYARSKAGPFFRPSTVRALLRNGALLSEERRGQRILTALAKE